MACLTAAIGQVDVRGERHELIRDLRHLVAVAHPDFGLVWHAGKQVGMRGDLDLARPYSRAGALLHFAPQHVAGELHAVADAQDRNSQPEQPGVAASALLVDAIGSARENQPARTQFGMRSAVIEWRTISQ